MTNTPRALTDIGTNNELSLLRSEPQSTRLYVTVHKPVTVYSARLAAVPSTTDQVTSITYNSGTGTHTDILADQTIYVGTSAGAYDLGMVRLRSTSGIGATSGTFTIAEESEIDWQSGAYLTVKDEFAIWPRHIRLSGTTPYMDYDVAYSNQNSHCDSMPVMGQHRIAWLPASGTVSVTFDGSDSWALNNSITGYTWAAPGASATSGLSTATPTITYNAAGVYRVSLTVTNSDSASFTGYRYVFVLAEVESWARVAESISILTDIRIDSLSGDYDNGGWTAEITAYDNADSSDIRDRALCIIHTQDTYGNYNGSAGFVNGAKNILYIGWIAGETITRAADGRYSSVSFTVAGPQYWLGRMTAFPVGLKDSRTSPSKWTRFLGLTAKATVWHLLHWRTTLTRCSDVYPLTHAYRAARIEAPGGQTLWEQLKYIESSTCLAEPCADRYGRLFNQVNQQLLDDTARADVPECAELTGADIAEDVEIERRISQESSIVDLSGVSYDGTNPTAYFSLSPGRVFRHYGSPEVVEQLVLYDQATTNTLCGLYAGWKNNEYPLISLRLGSGNRFIDIAPYQYWLYPIAAADTPRGISGTLRLIPRRVRYEWVNTGGYLLASADCEAESFAEMAITGDTPTIEVEDPPPPPPPPPPDPVPVVNSDAKIMWLLHYNASATPSCAVIYEILDDFNAPVYTSLIPPSSLNIDYIQAGNYRSSTDELLLIAHATSTPTAPGWLGGASHILVKVSGATSGSPTWSLLATLAMGGTNGDIPDGYLPDGGTYFGGPYPHIMRAGSNGLRGIGYKASYFINKYLVYFTSDLNKYGSYGEAQGYTNPITHITGPLPIGANSGNEIGWAQGSLIYYDVANNYFGGMPGYADILNGDTAHYTFQAFCIRGGSTQIDVYALRRRLSDNYYQIVHTSLLGTGSGGAITPWEVQLTCDEFGIGDYPLWTNTYTKSDYLTVTLGNTGSLYYTTDAATWNKMSGTVPGYGFAHYLKKSGGNDFIWISSGGVSSGNEFARYTTDISDLGGNPWTQMTGNMWSGSNKIITSGDLFITDSWLSF